MELLDWHSEIIQYLCLHLFLVSCRASFSKKKGKARIFFINFGMRMSAASLKKYVDVQNNAAYYSLAIRPISLFRECLNSRNTRVFIWCIKCNTLKINNFFLCCLFRFLIISLFRIKRDRCV